MRLAWFPGLCLLAMGCASPMPAVWPPAPGSPAHEIIVSVDTWHAVIGFPRHEKGREGSAHPSRLLYEEWGYAEQAWYLEGRHGLTGVLRALFWPTDGVVEVGTHAQPWSERTPDPPGEQFHFRLSDEGHLRLRQFLEDSRSAKRPLRVGATSAFYPAQHGYSVLHHCHHYAAHALRAAGLPVSPPWALTRTLLVTQLRQAERHAAEVAQPVTVEPEVR